MNDKMDLRIPKKSATLRSMVEEHLRRAIATGMFKPGDRLIERELCEMLDVSRTSLREAIRQLEAEGVVTSLPHRGPVVSTLDASEVAQLYRMRELLEGYCGREFARTGTEEEIEQLKAAAESFATAAENLGADGLIEEKTRFYSYLMAGSRNKFVQESLLRLQNRIIFLRMSSMSQPGRLEQSISEIREIVSAIAARDPDRAEAACVLHIRNAAESCLKAFPREMLES